MALEGLYQLGRQAWCPDSRVLGEPKPRERPNHMQGGTSGHGWALPTVHHLDTATAFYWPETALSYGVHSKEQGSPAEPAM